MTGKVRVALNGDVVDAWIPPGTVVFVDGPLTPEGTLGRTYNDGVDVERRAAADLAATVDAAVAAISSVPAGPVRVSGQGALAEAVRRRLGDQGVTSDEDEDVAPAAVIVASGASEQIMDAVRAVANDGYVVLALPPLASGIRLRTYADLHVRGLTLVGVPWVHDPSAGVRSDELVVWALENLGRASVGGSVPPGPWSCISP